MVRIVRELDRYHGFVAAARRLPEPSRTDAPAEGAMAFGAALVCRPDIALQDFEKIKSAPGIVPAPSAAGQAREQDPAFAARHVIARSQQGDGAIQGPSDALGSLGSPPPGLFDPGVARDDGENPPSLSSSQGDYERPEIPPQDLEKIKSAPGIATAAENLVHENAAPEEECAFARREPEEDVSSLDAPPNDRQNPPAWSMLWDARLRVVSQHGARQSRPAAPAGDDRPGIRPQTPEKIKSAPGDGWPAEAAPAPDNSTPMILTPTGWRRQNVRMALNGVAAC